MVGSAWVPIASTSVFLMKIVSPDRRSTKAASSAKNMSLNNTIFTLVLARRRVKFSSFPSLRVWRRTPLLQNWKACWRRRENKIPNRVGAHTQPWFTPLRSSNGRDIIKRKKTYTQNEMLYKLYLSSNVRVSY